MNKIGVFIGTLVLFAFLNSGCGSKLRSTSGLPSPAPAAPISFAAGTIALSNAFASGSDSVLQGFSTSVAIANVNGVHYGAVIDPATGEMKIEHGSGIRSSLSRVRKAVTTLPGLNLRLTHVGGMGFDASQTILYVLETVSGPSDSSHHQSGSLYSINTASQNSVTEFDLGSTVDLPLGFAYVGGSNPSLYFSSKNGTDGRVYSIPATGGTPTVFTSGLTEPTGLAADDTYIYVYDISGSAAKIYRSPITGIQSGNLEEIPVSMIAASPASQPLALSSQDDFHTLFYVDGLQVRALDLKELTVGTIAASSSLIVNTGKLQDISSVSFSSSDSVLMVSSLAEKKVLYARAGSS